MSGSSGVCKEDRQREHVAPTDLDSPRDSLAMKAEWEQRTHLQDRNQMLMGGGEEQSKGPGRPWTGYS
jgi:hypothetical protein